MRVAEELKFKYLSANDIYEKKTIKQDAGNKTWMNRHKSRQREEK